MDIRNKTQAISTAILLTSAIIWGFAFVAQRAGMRFIGPFAFNGIRFALGSLTLLPFYIREARAPKRADDVTPDRLTRGTILLAGIVLFVSANLQQLGLVYTTAGKAGFITGLYVVIVPMLGVFLRQRVRPPVWLGCILAAGGLYLLSIAGAFSISLGDSLVLGSALGWAIHVHVVGWLARRAHPLSIAIVQFATCAMLSLIAAGLRGELLLQPILDAGWMIAYAGVLSVGVAYTLQIVAQRTVPPARAGIVLSLEAVFAALGGWGILHETLSPRGLVGCGLMLCGMVLAQLQRRQRPATVT